MPAGVLTREWTIELTARAAADGERERVIEGRIVPFGEVATVRDAPGAASYRETIARGALDGIDAERVLLDYLTDPPRGFNSHDGSRLAGRGLAIDSRDDGAYGAFLVARTAAGDELLGLADARVLRSMSIQFQPVAERRRDDGVVERTAIDLRRVTVVPVGAYTGAAITAVRASHSEGGEMPPNETPPADDAEETPPEAGTPAPAGDKRPNRTRVTTQVDVERQEAEAELAARAAAERSDIADLATRGPVARNVRGPSVYGPHSEFGFLADGLAMARGDSAAAERQRRHYAHLADVSVSIERATAWDAAGGLVSRAGDVLSSEIPGAYPNDYLPGLLTPRILKGRPMGSFYQRFPISDARPRIFPKATTATTVAVQSAEGAALSSTDFATTAVTATPLMYGAFTDVSRQAIDGADPAAQAMVLQDLVEAYSQASETVIKTAVEAGASAGVAITAATPYAGAIANVVNYYGTRFTPATGAFIPAAQFSTLLAQADTTGRPLVPQLGAVNSDGVVNVNGGITAPLLSALGTLSWASTANVWVFGVPSDYVIFESSIAQFSYDQVVGPQAVRIGIWAYLVVGTRLGSLKVTAA